MTTLVMNFGRYQGPHKGHKMLIDFMRELAIEHNGDYMIFPTKTHNAKNPIPFDKKVEIMRGLMPEHAKHISTTHPNAIVKILQEQQQHYDNIIFVCGSDQVRNFSTFLPNYNDLEYTFETIQVVATGNTRNDGLTGNIESCSASKMREFVMNNDMDSFLRCVPETAPAINIAKAFATMSIYLNVKEAIC